ncbi:MAG TPA: DUF927 domain-containing protein, partial [Actinomycetota bacterium]|nr:DUF927 domain-containing protein [Actinomycetota bacterium]
MGVEQTLVAVPSCEACGTGCLHGYGTVRGESNAARLGWREAMEGAFAEPPLAVLVGAAFGSLLLDRIGADGFHVHIHGAPRTARSLSVRSAVAVAGNPDLVLRDIAPEAAGHRLAATAPMPVGFRRAEPALLAEIGSGGLGGVVLTTGDRPVPG